MQEFREKIESTITRITGLVDPETQIQQMNQPYRYRKYRFIERNWYDNIKYAARSEQYQYPGLVRF